MLQPVACLKLLSKRLPIADVTRKCWFQALQEMQLSIELHTESVAGGSLCLQLFNGLKTGLAI